MKKILLIGASLRSGNRGINALTRGAIYTLLKNYSEVEINIITYAAGQKAVNRIDCNNRQYYVEEDPCPPYSGIYILLFSFLRLIFPGKLLPRLSEKNLRLVKLMLDCDYVMDLSEGDSFSDIYGIKRFIVHANLKLSAIKLGKRLILLPQTIGPFKNPIVKAAAKYILGRADYCYARDTISYNYLAEDLAVNKSKFSYIPDMAFNMAPSKKISIETVYPKGKIGKRVLVGFNISALLYNGGYSRNNMFKLSVDYKELVDEIMEYFLSKPDTCLLLVPHVICGELPVEDDMSICKEIFYKYRGGFPQRIYLVDKAYREDELKNIIGSCDFFMGSRMHACIGAVSMNVPTVPIAYSRKFTGLWISLGISQCVADLRSDSKDEIINIIKGNFANRAETRKYLEGEISYVKKQAFGMFKAIGL